ncbi:MAG: hypothetical protein LBI42_01055 [Chitinispirillales bacterium]|jgi:hypothetical protein|nr:hypothetical protein [Chitinispirillales bacterium]
MSDEHEDKRQQANSDSFEENLRQILSGDDEHSPAAPRHIAPKPRATPSKALSEAAAPEQKYPFWSALIRVAAFAVMVGLLVMFVCRTMGQ